MIKTIFSLFNDFVVFATVKSLFCIFLVLPLFLLATPLEKLNDELASNQSDPSVIVFITDGVKIVGEDNIYNAEVVVDEKIKLNAIPKIAKDSPIKSEANTATKDLQEFKNSHKKKEVTKSELICTFSNTSSENSTFQNTLAKVFRAVISSRYLLQKIDSTDRYETENVEITSQLKKQKFYTSLSYLQFGKYSSSSLRGPPFLSFYS